MSYPFTSSFIASGLNYKEYTQLFERLVKEGATTGADQSSAMIEYTKMNLVRSHRMNKVTILPDALKDRLNSITTPLYFVLITEPWCGDAAHSVPGIAHLVDAIKNSELRIFLRDEQPDLMNAYLTKGGKAIPILIVLRQDTLEELFHWGPRPAAAQELVWDHKKRPDYTKEAMVNDVFKWYNQYKNQLVLEEISQLLEQSIAIPSVPNV